MDARHNNSVDELRRRSEASRSELAGTVGELREKVSDTASELKTLVSPSHIKHEIKSYIREERESLVRSLERQVRENPLRAAAVGAAIAYPAWGLLRAIPTPLLLIGAGLWLTGSKGRQTVSQVNARVMDTVERGTAAASEFADTVKSEIAERADAVSRRVGEAGDAVTRTLSDTGDAVTRTLSDAGEAVTRGLSKAGDAVASRATAATDQARAAMHDMRDAVGLNSAAPADNATTAARGFADATARTFSDATDTVAAAGKKTQSAVMEFVDKNPLLVAGIGAAIGAFIAAALPPSNAENRLFGEPSDDLKDKVRGAASQGLDQAKDLAAGVVGDVASAVAREGLDGPGVQKAAETVTQGLKSIAERGVETALGDTKLAPDLQPELNRTFNQS